MGWFADGDRSIVGRPIDRDDGEHRPVDEPLEVVLGTDLVIEVVDDERRRQPDEESRHGGEQGGSSRSWLDRLLRDLRRLDDRCAARSQRCVHTKLVQRGAEVRELGDEALASRIVIGQVTDLGLEPIDGRLNLDAGRQEFVDRLLASHLDVGHCVCVGERGCIRRVRVTNGDRNDVGATDRSRGRVRRLLGETEVRLHALLHSLPLDHLDLGLDGTIVEVDHLVLEESVLAAWLHEDLSGRRIDGCLERSEPCCDERAISTAMITNHFRRPMTPTSSRGVISVPSLPMSGITLVNRTDRETSRSSSSSSTRHPQWV